MSPEQKKYYCELLEHAPEKLLEDLAWLYDTRNVAIQRHAHALRERERWHGKYMMVKHENNKLRQRLRPLRISGICPQCKTEQAVNKNRRNRYYCAECGVRYELYVDKQLTGGYAIYRARLLGDVAPHK